MSPAQLLLLGLWGSVLPLRLWLWFSPNTDLNLGPYNLHHLYTGQVLLTLCLLPLLLRPQNPWRKAQILGLGAGLGLVLDEWVYLIATDGSNAAYWLPVSVWGAFIALALTSLVIGILSWRNSAPTLSIPPS
ncbi:MAG: hypothetical protein RL095_4185 [Verrucomicrobiota bacterium]|jgi:hypothetical protein